MEIKHSTLFIKHIQLKIRNTKTHPKTGTLNVLSCLNVLCYIDATVTAITSQQDKQCLEPNKK